MKGNTFTAPDGKIHKVLDFDEINKMAYIRVFAENYRWVHESEYSTWTVNDSGITPYYYIPDMPAQMTDEQAASIEETLPKEIVAETPVSEIIEEISVPEKPKKTRKKKTDATD